MFYPTLITTCPFPEKLHVLRGSERPLESPEEQRSPAGAPESDSVWEQPVHTPLTKAAVFPANNAVHHEPDFPRVRRPHEPQNKGPAHYRNSILNLCTKRCKHLSGCKKIRPLTFAGISLIVKKYLEEKCCAYVSADTCRSSDECGTLSGFRAVAFCMGHPLFNHEL